jgi:dGTPase
VSDFGELLWLPDGSACRADLLAERYARNVANPGPYDETWVQYVRTREASQQLIETKDRRSPAEKDLHRVIYSGYVQRLAGVAQVVTPASDSPALHSRATHSAKVAYLSRAIASNITRRAREGAAAEDGKTSLSEIVAAHGGLDIAAAEAAGWAHDIGHPPFGHVGEQIIDEWLQAKSGDRRAQNGFEGNAQTFRTLVRLDQRATKSLGLEITAVTLAAVLKYPWLRTFGNKRLSTKFGAYHTEAKDLQRVRSWFTYGTSGAVQAERGQMQTLEASIMDVADDITYAMHDLQDFVLAGVIRPSSVKHDLEEAGGLEETDAGDAVAPGVATFIDLEAGLAERYPAYFDPKLYREALNSAVDLMDLLDLSENETPEAVAEVRAVVADRIGRLVDAVEVYAQPRWEHGPAILLDRETWHQVQVLKQITKSYVIETPLVGKHQAAQHTALSELLDRLEQWCARKNAERSLPLRLRSHIRLAKSLDTTAETQFDEDPTKRAIADYCCSLTDLEAYRLSRYLQGHEIPRILL